MSGLASFHFLFGSSSSPSPPPFFDSTSYSTIVRTSLPSTSPISPLTSLWLPLRILPHPLAIARDLMSLCIDLILSVWFQFVISPILPPSSSLSSLCCLLLPHVVASHCSLMPVHTPPIVSI